MKRLIATLCLILCFPIIALAADDDIRRPKSGMSLGMNPSLSGGGFAYLLRDDFSIAVAAGDFSGSALNAVPGPGTRTVVDTDTPKNLSISSGRLQIEAHATPAYGDPGIWYDLQTRTLGKILVFNAKPAAINSRLMAGYDANTSGSHSASNTFYFDDSPSINAYDNSVSIKLITPYSAATDYYLSIIMRSTGAYYLCKISGNWCLLWISSVVNSNLYPSEISGSLAGTYSSDFIRIPNYLWTPRPISADSFGGTWPTTDGGGLTGIEAGGSGLTWTPSATWSISSGTAVNAPVAGSEILSNTGFETAGGGGADVFANWAEGVSGTSTVNDEGVVVHGGSHACRLDIDASNSQAYVAQGAITVGSWCRMSAWAKVDDATGSPKFKIGSASAVAATLLNVGLTTTYVQYINTFRADNASCAINRSDNCASKKIYVDDVSWKSLTLNQLITSINHTSTPDCYMSVKPTIATGFQAGIAFNVDDPNNPQNFNLVYYNQNDQKVYWDRCVAGTYTNHFATAATYAAAAPLVVRKIGTSVYVWYNNAYVNSGTATVTTGNYHGMFQTGNGATETKLDDWVAYGSGTNGEYGILNAFSN